MIQTLIKYVLGKLAGITARQWAVALHYVVMVANHGPESGADKKAAVEKAVRKLWPEIQTFALNLLIETALAFSRKK
jgi:hypothetical protein